MSLADVYVHKVASHEDEHSSAGPLFDFARTWNDMADFQAGLPTCTDLLSLDEFGIAILVFAGLGLIELA